MSIEIPQQLVVSHLDLTPLLSVLTTITRRLDEVAGGVALLQQAQRTMADELAETVQRVNVSQKHLEVMFETVSTCNKKVLDLERTSMTKDEANAKFIKLIDDLASTTENVRKMNINKIDKTSEELEIRVRLAASEACIGYLTKKDAETKEYLKSTLDASEQKVIRIAYARAEDIASKTDIRCVQLGHRIDDVLQSIHAVKRDAEQELQNQASFDRTLVAKLEQHEIFMNKLEDGLGEEVDEVAHELHLVMQRMFGVSYSDLERLVLHSASVTDQWAKQKGEEERSDSAADVKAARMQLVLPEEHLVRLNYARQTRRVTRSIEFTKGWRALRSANGKALLAAPMACSNLDAGIDLGEQTAFRKLDQAMHHEIKSLESGGGDTEGPAKRSALLAKQYPTDVLPLLRKSPLLLDAAAGSKAVMEATVRETSQTLEKAIGEQVEALTKEVRGKMSNNKAMELIDQRTTRMLADAMVPANTAIEHLSRNSISRSEVYEALSNKADISRLEVKADPAYVRSVADEVREEVNVSISDLKDMYQKLLSELTLFRHKQLIDDKSGGALPGSPAGGPAADALGTADPSAENLAAGAVTKCLSCRQPLPPSSNRAQSAAARQAQGDAALQEAQKQVHEGQVKQSRTPSKPQQGPTAGEQVVGQWAAGIEAKYTSTIAAQLQPGSKPRPPSAR